MGTWRTYGIGATALLVTAAVGAEITSIDVVAPPVGAALLVLGIAAMSVDYFGIARRQTGWTGTIVPTRASRAMVEALVRRFHREREAGAIRTGATARTLLLALAEHRDLARAGDVVDFLSTEAATRAHRDVVADALRALALAELGRVAEARVVDRSIGDRAGTQPVVALARARILELDGRVHDAIAAIDRALGASRTGAVRDLAVARARLLARAGRMEDAQVELAKIAAAGGRGVVEGLLAGDAGLALAARQALGMGEVYR